LEIAGLNVRIVQKRSLGARRSIGYIALSPGFRRALHERPLLLAAAVRRSALELALSGTKQHLRINSFQEPVWLYFDFVTNVVGHVLFYPRGHFWLP